MSMNEVEIHREPSTFIAKHNDEEHDQRNYESIPKNKRRGSLPNSWTVVVEIEEESSTQIHTNGREGTPQTQEPHQLRSQPRKLFTTATAIDFTRRVQIHTHTTIIAQSLSLKKQKACMLSNKYYIN